MAAKNNNEKIVTASVNLSDNLNNSDTSALGTDSLAINKATLSKKDSSSPELFLSKDEDMLTDPFILNYLNGEIKKYDVTDKRREE